MRQVFSSFSLLKSYKRSFSISIFYTILHIVFNVLSVALFIPFLDLIFNPEKLISEKPFFSFTSIDSYTQYFRYYLSTIIIEKGQTYGIALVCVLNICMFFFKNVFSALGTIIVASIRVNVANDFRLSLYRKYVHLTFKEIGTTKKGNVLSMFSNDITEIENTLVASLYNLIKSPLTIIFFVIAMLYINLYMTLISLLMIPVSGLIISKIGDSLKRNSDNLFDFMGIVSARIDEMLSGVRTIRRNNVQSFFVSRFEKNLIEHKKNFINLSKKTEFGSPVNEILGAVFVSVVLFIGGTMVISDEYSIEASEFITLIIMMINLISPSKVISKAYFDLQRSLSAYDRLSGIFAKEEEKEMETTQKDVTPITSFNSDITFSNISFTYTSEKDPVLQNLNLVVQKGKKVAIVGTSGSGKTTIFELLYKNIKAQKGDITIDGKSLQNIPNRNIRDLFSIVPQETFITEDTVANNINFGLITENDDDVITAAKLANCTEFIDELPNRYNTLLSDSGRNLSGGQRQRIGIARTLLRDSEIILLDEATSALDVNSESEVLTAIRNSFVKKTVIMVTHRITSIQWVDEIFVLKGGEIAERGTYDELREKGGIFSAMLKVQAE